MMGLSLLAQPDPPAATIKSAVFPLRVMRHQSLQDSCPPAPLGSLLLAMKHRATLSLNHQLSSTKMK